jgi:hypothetical protein
MKENGKQNAREHRILSLHKVPSDVFYSPNCSTAMVEAVDAPVALCQQQLYTVVGTQDPSHVCCFSLM